MLEWKRAAGSRWVAEAPVGDDCYEVFAAYSAFTCDEDGAYDGGWSSDAVGDFESARSCAERLVREGRFGFMGSQGPFELFRVRPGLDACLGAGGRGIAVSCDWMLYLGDEQVGYYLTPETAMRVAEEDARERFGA